VTAAKKVAPSSTKTTSHKASGSATTKRASAGKKVAAKKPGSTASAAKKAAPATKKKAVPAKKSAPVAKKSAPPAKKSAPSAKKAVPAKKAAAPAKKSAPVAKKAAAPAKKATAPAKKGLLSEPPPKPTGPGPYAKDAKFLEEQRGLLLEERAVYAGQATDLRAEADSLALEREPGDVQFDEESGEGGTVTVDRERNLALSAQAHAAVEEIDDALQKIDKKQYGTCERCHQPIPKARLRALPFARLCVACKSGGLTRR
jgi:RNA polymerase-binding transcription factor DksA